MQQLDEDIILQIKEEEEIRTIPVRKIVLSFQDKYEVEEEARGRR